MENIFKVLNRKRERKLSFSQYFSYWKKYQVYLLYINLLFLYLKYSKKKEYNAINKEK